MNIKELRERLVAERVRADAVDLDSPYPSEAYSLQRRGDEWVTFYAERGYENALEVFATEADACRRLLDIVLDDPTTRRA